MTTSVPGNLIALSDSYRGIVNAFNVIRQQQGLAYKSYDASFAGIVEAVKDLAILGNADWGELPPGWEIDEETGEGSFQFPPKNGSLWFDERQGRLFAYVDDGYYQANGNDGLAYVGETPPAVAVTGGQWYNPVTKGLYLYDGLDWQLIDMAGTLTTEDMQLNSITALYAAAVGEELIDPYTVGQATPTQGTYNRWVARCLKSIEESVITNKYEPTVHSDTSFPTAPSEGDLWFDTSDLNLYIYYTDSDSSQWVPAFNTLNDNADFVALSASLDTLTAINASEHAAINDRIDTIPLSDYALNTQLTDAQTTLQDNINTLETEVGDLNRFATYSQLQDVIANNNTRFEAIEGSEPDLSNFLTEAEINAALVLINNTAIANAQTAQTYTDAKAAEVTALIPDISGKANTAELQAFIATAAQNYFPRLGGTLDGTFGMRKADISLPSFDFSNAHYYGNKVFKFKTNSVTDQYVEFGTNTKPWEYAWQFGANEDFCWKHNDAGKVFSISEQGPACEKLTIGSFGANTNAGRNVSTGMEVGERLRTYENTFRFIKQAASHSADFDIFKSKLIEALASI